MRARHLRKKHLESSCSYNRPCFYCGEDQQRALRESRRQYQKEPRGNRSERISVTQTDIHNNSLMRTRPETKEETIQIDSTIMSYKNLDNLEQLVILLTIKAFVSNSLNFKREKTHLFFDLGSQRSFISESPTRKSGLIPLTEEVLSIYTFAAKNIKSFSLQEQIQQTV